MMKSAAMKDERQRRKQGHDWTLQSTLHGLGGSAHWAVSARERGAARTLRIGGLQPGFLAPAAVRRAYDGIGHQHPLGTRFHAGGRALSAHSRLGRREPHRLVAILRQSTLVG